MIAMNFIVYDYMTKNKACRTMLARAKDLFFNTNPGNMP